jgi:hypothetical protein
MATRKPHLTAEEKLAFATRVRNSIESGAVLWVSVPHTSRSNMSYTINARLIGGDDAHGTWLNYWLGSELGATLDANDNLKQNGCGTDRAFELACNISHILKGYGLGDYRNGNDIARSWF